MKLRLLHGCLLGTLVGCGPDGVGAGDDSTGSDSAGSEDTGSGPDQAELDQAIADLDTMVANAIEYFEETHPSENLPPHRCPDLDWESDLLEAGLTPPHGTHCSGGADGLCTPAASDGDDSVDGWYSIALWYENQLWSRLEFAKTEPHAFHYNIVIDNDIESDYGSCQFTAAAYGDLDGDLLFSTYERRVMVDENGAQIEPLLFVANAGE